MAKRDLVTRLAEHRTCVMRERLGRTRRVLEVCCGSGGDTIARATRWPVLGLRNWALADWDWGSWGSDFGRCSRVATVAAVLAPFLREALDLSAVEDPELHEPLERTLQRFVEP